MNRMFPTSPSWNVRYQWLSLRSWASFLTTSYITLASVDVYVLLETTNHLLRLLDEVGYYFLVIFDVIALAKIYLGENKVRKYEKEIVDDNLILSKTDTKFIKR